MMLLIITALYTLIIAIFTLAWLFKSKRLKPNSTTYSYAVVVPFRNEAENLPRLVKALNRQDFNIPFRVYWVDDASTDGGLEWLQNEVLNHKYFRIISAVGAGKKQALLTAYNHVEEDYIITLDADCNVEEGWLNAISEACHKHEPKLLIGGVKINPVKSLWEKMQAIELQSLAASALGAGQIGAPILSFGANLIFAKALLPQIRTAINVNEPSGDDMFILEFCKRNYPKQIKALVNKQALVSTSAEPWDTFFKQRKRWASKSGKFTDWQIILVGLTVLGINTLLVAYILLSFFNPLLFKIVMLSLSIKLVIDLCLLGVSSAFFNTRKHLWVFPVLSLVYPFYVVYSSFSGFFTSIEWKGRVKN